MPEALLSQLAQSLDPMRPLFTAVGALYVVWGAFTIACGIAGRAPVWRPPKLLFGRISSDPRAARWQGLSLLCGGCWLVMASLEWDFGWRLVFQTGGIVALLRAQSLDPDDPRRPEAFRPPDLEAEMTFEPTDDDGRPRAFRSGFRALLFYDDMHGDAEYRFPDDRTVQPGESVVARVRLLRPHRHRGRLVPGTEFVVREGRRLLAQGRVARLLALADDPAPASRPSGAPIA